MSGTKEHCDGTTAGETIARCQRSEFDAVAANYQQMVDENVQITGENSDYFAAYKANYIARNVIRGEGPGKILDYGCGVGLLVKHLKRCLPGIQIDGYDISASSLDRIDPAFRAQGVFTNKLGALGRNYDAIVLANVLHHVRLEERRALIAEAASHLAPGGKMVIFEHNPLNPLTRWAVSRCPFDEGVTLLPASEVRSLCTDTLRLSQTDYIVFFPQWLSWVRPFERLLGWCPAGAQHATVACR
jgi:2-polyprenyl-3-methyl-5-hydroxy-6-metoxy-1,4-benzoquinol methylase